MRVVLAAALASLVAVPVASARWQPAPSYPVLHLERSGTSKSTLSTCTAHVRSRRRFVPVACEQPPRSNLLQQTVYGIYFGR